VEVSVGISAVGLSVGGMFVHVDVEATDVDVVVGKLCVAGTGVQETINNKIRKNTKACFIN
jgi:hypothetical protein